MQLQVTWLKPAVWGVIGGSLATMIVGFSWMGWVGGGAAERMAVERASSAVIVALTPSCVASFMKQPNAAAKLAAFQKIDSWRQRQLGDTGGWATPRGDKSLHSGLANACAEQLVKAKT